MGPDNNSRPTIEIDHADRDDLEAIADRWVQLASDQRRYDSYVRAEANRETMRETLGAHQINDGLLVARDTSRVPVPGPGVDVDSRTGTDIDTATDGYESDRDRDHDRDRIVGFASFHLERGSLELRATRGMLSNIYVDPAYRGQGIGTALLEAAEAELEAKGAETVVLEVMADNEAARRFYRRHGYDTYRVAMERDLEGEGEGEERAADAGSDLEGAEDHGDDDTAEADGRSENDTHSREDG